MIEYVLFFFLFFSIIPKINIEGIKKDCCGNLSSDLIDFNCADNETPEAIKRCYKASQEEYDCDNCGDICNNGEGECVPTSEGGYCQIDPSTRKFYEGNEWKEITKNFGEKINDSIRARRKYKNIYSRKCDPFASEMDEGELERKDRKGNYKGDDEDFDAIDKIESSHSEGNSYIGYTIFALSITVFVILIAVFRNQIKSKLKIIFT